LNLLSRKEAKATGSVFYYTGITCKHGHTDQRYTNNGMCVTCSKKYSSEQIETPESKRERYLRNKEAYLENKKRYYQENREEIRAKQKVYCDANKNALAISNKKWREANPDKVAYSSAKRRALKALATPAWYDAEEVKYIYNLAQERGLHVDHIVPLNHPLVCGLHVQDNLRCIPKELNLWKSNKLLSLA